LWCRSDAFMKEHSSEDRMGLDAALRRYWRYMPERGCSAGNRAL
jgi:hypothetical protein